MRSHESSHPIKEKFLNENENITEIPILPTDSCDIGSDDEVWMLQCPQSIEIDALINRKLKLPGRSRHEHIETVADKYPEVHVITLATRSKRSDKLRNIPIQGHIVVRERAKNREIEELESDQHRSEEPEAIKFPDNFKIRHPLLGAFFEDKLQLRPAVLARLKEADGQGKKQKKKRIKIERECENDRHPVKIEHTGENEVRVKKEKKRKRQAEESFESEVEPHAKRIKSESVNNKHADLDWIKQI